MLPTERSQHRHQRPEPCLARVLDAARRDADQQRIRDGRKRHAKRIGGAQAK